MDAVGNASEGTLCLRCAPCQDTRTPPQPPPSTERVKPDPVFRQNTITWVGRRVQGTYWHGQGMCVYGCRGRSCHREVTETLFEEGKGYSEVFAVGQGLEKRPSLQPVLKLCFTHEL